MREEKIESTGGLTNRTKSSSPNAATTTTTTTTTTKSSIADNEPVSPQISDHSNDAGNQSNDHYKARLSPFRYKMRSLLLPLSVKKPLYLQRCKMLYDVLSLISILHGLPI